MYWDGVGVDERYVGPSRSGSESEPLRIFVVISLNPIVKNPFCDPYPSRSGRKYRPMVLLNNPEGVWSQNGKTFICAKRFDMKSTGFRSEGYQF